MITQVTVSKEHLVEGLREWAAILLMFAGLASLAHCNQGCQVAKDSMNDPAHNYATEIIACAATAGYPSVYDRDSDMRCRGKVDQKYGVGAYRDAGAGK